MSVKASGELPSRPGFTESHACVPDATCLALTSSIYSSPERACIKYQPSFPPCAPPPDWTFPQSASEPNSIGKHLLARTGGGGVLPRSIHRKRYGEPERQAHSSTLSGLGPRLSSLHSLCSLCPSPATLPGVWIFFPIKSLCKKDWN